MNIQANIVRNKQIIVMQFVYCDYAWVLITCDDRPTSCWLYYGDSVAQNISRETDITLYSQ